MFIRFDGKSFKLPDNSYNEVINFTAYQKVIKKKEGPREALPFTDVS
jgi:hypothetical protein